MPFSMDFPPDMIEEESDTTALCINIGSVDYDGNYGYMRADIPGSTPPLFELEISPGIPKAYPEPRDDPYEKPLSIIATRLQKGENYLKLYIHADGPISGNTFYNQEENTLWLYLPDAAFKSPGVLSTNNTPHTLLESIHYIDDIRDLKLRFTLKVPVSFNLRNIKPVDIPLYTPSDGGYDQRTGLVLTINPVEHSPGGGKTPGSAPVYSPVDVTPPWLNFSPHDICTEGDFAYIAAGNNGLHIFDVSDASNPVWVNAITDLGDSADGVNVSGGYAYVSFKSYLFVIVDVDPPEFAHIVKTIGIPKGWTSRATIAGDFAYVPAGGPGLIIIDIQEPESAEVIHTIDTEGYTLAVAVEGDFAYIADGRGGLLLVDIDPPGEAEIVNTVEIAWGCEDVAISEGFAFIANQQAGLTLVDVRNPDLAYIDRTIETKGEASRIAISNGYAYLRVTPDNIWPNNLEIFRITPPGFTESVNHIEMPHNAAGIAFNGDYAYIAESNAGLLVLDVGNPETAEVINTVHTIGYAMDTEIAGNYAYIADSWAGLTIVDITSPESAVIVANVDTPACARKLDISGGYAFVADGQGGGLQIIDIDPPESAHIVSEVRKHSEYQGLFYSYSNTYDVAVSGILAYIVDVHEGLIIVDVRNPEAPRIIANLNTPGSPSSIALKNGYAIIPDGDEGVQVIDIDPPRDAHIATTVVTPWRATYISISGDQAYIGSGGDNYIAVLDISSPESTSIIRNIPTQDITRPGPVIGAHLFATSSRRLQIYDISPVDKFKCENIVNLQGFLKDVCVSGNYAYVAGTESGLRIIKLR